MMSKSSKVLFLVLLGLGVFSAMAIPPGENVAEMTCAFNVEDTVLPAGKYHLRQLSPELFVIDNQDLKVSVLFMTQPSELTKGETSKFNELVFRVYGDRYFLSSLRFLGDQNEHDLIVHSAERGLMGKGTPRTETVRCLMAPGPK
jgi:hypothetical protein